LNLSQHAPGGTALRSGTGGTQKKQERQKRLKGEGVRAESLRRGWDDQEEKRGSEDVLREGAKINSYGRRGPVLRGIWLRN